MTIQTKYDIGSLVFVIHEQRVRLARVLSILVNKSGYRYSVEVNPDSAKPELRTFAEDALMGSGEELIADIESQLNNLLNHNEY